MESCLSYEGDLNLKDTELRLGLPWTNEKPTIRNNKRSLPDAGDEQVAGEDSPAAPPPAKAQVVGWPPIRSYRKNNMIIERTKVDQIETGGIYVKVSVDGAPYLRKMDLAMYNGYSQLLEALGSMFRLTIGEYSEREGYKGSEYSPTYEDKDGDWMLVGDVPWEMFKSSCKRLRIVKGMEAKEI
ncbi:auxin-induced protein 22D-like [Impatiens glandulifera]|uniref:auxin-induced protein 22D-like n=1 Tax=Impatiens glandulifera TaxID=253017 RepID=UPI001FB05189|nr:auxin-induced protein 22D-like [Impatiens glandulifera]